MTPTPIPWHAVTPWTPHPIVPLPDPTPEEAIRVLLAWAASQPIADRRVRLALEVLAAMLDEGGAQGRGL